MTLEEYLQQLLPAQQPVYQPTAVQGLLTPRQDEVTAYDPSLRRQGANATQGLLENIGINRGQARQVSQTLLGGESSMMPVGMGVADFTPFAGYALGAGESAEGVGQAKKEFEAGNYGSAALQYALSSLGLLPGAIGATAFHGTPNKVVDKFNLNKVGTGEGAQSYGYGMYFAENPEVARAYKNMLVKEPSYIENKTGKIIDSNSPEYKDVVERQLRMENNGYGEDFDKKFTVREGNLYKVDIPDADIPKMLDWDKPFNQQTPEVQSAFNKLYSDPKIADSDNVDWFKNIDKDRASMSAMYNNLSTSDNLKGAKDVSRLLSEQGVAGVRYLDESSRGAGKGTSNFVTFNPEQVKILEENGINYDELMKSGLLSSKTPTLRTPQDEAMDIAKLNASLPVELGGLGLPLENTAMDRAQAMGFNINNPVFHGTNKNISEFDIKKASDKTGNVNANLGIFSTPNADEASRYATGWSKQDSNVLPLFIKSENPYEMSYNDFSELAMLPYRKMMADPAYNPNAVVKFNDKQGAKSAAERLKQYEKDSIKQVKSTRQDLLNQGYDTINVLKGNPMEEVIAMKPSNIRSKFAAFDPMRSQESNILASILGGLGLGGLLATREDEEKL